MSSDNHRTRFEEQGYLIVENLLSARNLAASSAEIERLHDLAASDDPAMRGRFEREPFAEGAAEEERPVIRKFEQTGAVSPLFHDLARRPDLITILRELLGPDLLLFRSTLMLKPAFHGSIHAFHQDTSYWPMRPPHLVTVSIALTDATPENGCFQVLPGSHRWDTRQMKEWGAISRPQDAALTDRSDIDTSGAIQLPLRAGSALFFHSAIVHGSGPNRSPNPRHTALYAYFGADVKYVPGDDQPREMTYPVVAGLDGRTEMTFMAEREAG